jgi:hypothetical protein
VYLLWSYQRVFFGSITQEKNGTLPDGDMRERGMLFLMVVIMLWMGIGSPFFTRRTETSTQNVLQLMQRPQAYDAGNTNNHDLNGMDLNHPTMPVNAENSAASADAAGWVRSR